jgi:Tfp pilus assembly protein PilZ
VNTTENITTLLKFGKSTNNKTMKLIATALLKAQKEMGTAKKDAKNPFFKSNYADLNSIREASMPHLNNNGIVVLQPTAFIDGKNFIKTILLHESGESIEALTEIIYSKQNDAQSQGSGITYARRYGLQSLVNVGAEDDDGNKASNPTPQPAQVEKAWLNKDSEQFIKAKEWLQGDGTIDKIKAKYRLSKEVETLLTTL